MWRYIDLVWTDVSEERIASSCRLQPPAHAGSSLEDFSILKMEALCSSETSVRTRSTQRHIPEYGILRSHRCENLKSYTMIAIYSENRTKPINTFFGAECDF
jgi:hypothetical protein